MSQKKWWAPIVHFGTHTFVGSAIFIIIAAPAIGLSVLVEHLSKLGIPAFTLSVLGLLERVIVVFDATLFIVHLIFTGYSAFKEMKND